MDEPATQQDKNDLPRRQSFLPPVLFFCGLILGGYVLSEIDKASPGTASLIVRWIIGLAVVVFIGWLLIGKAKK